MSRLMSFMGLLVYPGGLLITIYFLELLLCVIVLWTEPCTEMISRPMHWTIVEPKTNLWNTDFSDRFIGHWWYRDNHMFSFHALRGFPGVISFQLAGHCVLSMTVVYETCTFDILWRPLQTNCVYIK